MTMLEAFVKERNEALFSLDREKIEAYMIKYGETEISQTPDIVFWASVYKAICGIKDAPEAIVSKAKAWLHEHSKQHMPRRYCLQKQGVSCPSLICSPRLS